MRFRAQALGKSEYLSVSCITYFVFSVTEKMVKQFFFSFFFDCVMQVCAEGWSLLGAHTEGRQIKTTFPAVRCWVISIFVYFIFLDL